MSIVLYYHQLDPGGQDRFPTAEYFGDTELVPALNRTEALRKLGCTHVIISTNDPNSVGKPGVASVEDGKTPDGEPYDWRKRRV